MNNPAARAMPSKASQPSGSAHGGQGISAQFCRATVAEAYFFLQCNMPRGLFLSDDVIKASPPWITVILANAQPDLAWRLVAEATRTHLELRKDIWYVLPGPGAVENSSPVDPDQFAPSDVGQQPLALTPGPQADSRLHGDLRSFNGIGVDRLTLMWAVLRMLNASVVVDPAVLEQDPPLILNLADGTFPELMQALGLRGRWRGDVFHAGSEQVSAAGRTKSGA